MVLAEVLGVSAGISVGVLGTVGLVSSSLPIMMFFVLGLVSPLCVVGGHMVLQAVEFLRLPNVLNLSYL